MLHYISEKQIIMNISAGLRLRLEDYRLVVISVLPFKNVPALTDNQ